MLKLIKNGEVFAPEPLGRKDILVVGERIACIGDAIDPPSGLGPGLDLEVIDAGGSWVFPGFIDGEHEACPTCGAACEIWTRVMGYYRPKAAFNTGKQGEYEERICFCEPREA